MLRNIWRRSPLTVLNGAKKKMPIVCLQCVCNRSQRRQPVYSCVLLYMPSGETLAAHHLSLLTNANLVEMPQALCHGE